MKKNYFFFPFTLQVFILKITYKGQNCIEEVITKIKPNAKAIHLNIPSKESESPKIKTITPKIILKKRSPLPTFFLILKKFILLLKKNYFRSTSVNLPASFQLVIPPSKSEIDLKPSSFNLAAAFALLPPILQYTKTGLFLSKISN
jgi:hypothetical protein